MSDWDVFVVAGPSGVGKSSVSYPLARHFDVAMTEVDDLVHAVEALTTPADQPEIHYWRTHPEAGLQLPAENVLEIHLDICRKLAPAIGSVIDNHIETGIPIVLDGDYILPESIAHYSERVSAVFVYEDDEDQIVENYILREPDEGRQRKRARVSWLFGRWLREECERLGLSAIPSRPWKTVIERAIERGLD
jgi:2-phosphoglycerate kinase